MNASTPSASRARLLLLMASVAFLAACGGGGGGGSETASPLSPSPAPAPSSGSGSQAPSAPSPVPAGTVTLYFSDCQSGASAGCTAGSNSNLGNDPSAPKRDLTGLDISRLGAGSQLLFKRGGAWNISRIDVHNTYATPSAPLVFDAYDSGTTPLLRAASGVAFQLGGGWGNTDNDGGYTFRNLRLQGGAGDADNWGIWLVQNVQGVTLDNVSITGFGLGINASGGAPYGITRLTVRNSDISRNASMGFLGPVSQSTFEGNLFEGNNVTGSLMSHALYLGSGNGNVIRNNRFIRNSVVSGQCTGGNVTAHGLIDGLLIEGNLIEQDAGSTTCAGFSITQGYDYVEAFYNVVVRGNTVVNAGPCTVCVNSAPGIVIESNRAIITNGRAHTVALTFGQNDTPMTNPVVRNNTLCTNRLDGGVSNLLGALLSGNVVRTGADATTGECAR